MTRAGYGRRRAHLHGHAGAALALVLACAGCGAIDPTLREGTWRPRGANDGNLAAMVADPRHLVEGRASATSDGVLAAAAIDRLHRDRVKPLIDTDFSAAGATGGGSAGGAGGGSGGDSAAASPGAN